MCINRQSVFFTDRFYYRKQIIFNLLSTENIISLVNIKKVMNQLIILNFNLFYLLINLIFPDYPRNGKRKSKVYWKYRY